MTRFRRAAFLSCLVLLSCRREKVTALNLPADLTTRPGNAATFTLTEKVVRMEPRPFLDSLRSVGSDNRVLVFDASDRNASQLTPGAILFVPGLAMRKVAVTERRDGKLIVGTEDAKLLEVFKNADVHWTNAVDFSGTRSAFDRALEVVEPNAYAAALSISGEDDGWSYSVTATPQPGQLNLQMTVSREYNGVKVRIEGAGTLRNFVNALRIGIKDGHLEELDYKNSDLNGVMNFNWEAGKESAGVEAAEQQVRLPSSFTIPLPIGGIPFSLEVSEALLIHPAFTGGHEIARGRFRVEYNGTQGIDFKEGNATADGQSQADGSILDHASVAPVAPVGFVVAAAMPRVELRLGSDSVWQTVKKFAPPGLADGLLKALGSTPFGQWFTQKVSDKLKTNAAAYTQVIISTSTIAAG